MVLKAWEAVSNNIIEKSFLVVGQSKISKPEDIDCLKKGRTCENAFKKNFNTSNNVRPLIMSAI